jgi:hypothetical protein
LFTDNGTTMKAGWQQPAFFFCGRNPSSGDLFFLLLREERLREADTSSSEPRSFVHADAETLFQRSSRRFTARSPLTGARA